MLLAQLGALSLLTVRRRQVDPGAGAGNAVLAFLGPFAQQLVVQFHAAHRPTFAPEAAQTVSTGASTAPALATPASEPQPGVGPAEATDPVCGMTVDVATARFASELEGTTYYFCCPACKKKFEADPAQYLAVKT